MFQGTEKLSGIEPTSIFIELALPLEMIEQLSSIDCEIIVISYLSVTK